MKILVFGSNGMAGHIITEYLKLNGYNITTVARNNSDINLNIEDTASTKKFLERIKNDYDYIINCVGLLVKDSNNNLDRAILVNGWFPHTIEFSIANSKTKLIHLSTDCVFDGKKGNYVESDFHTETNFYGRTKSLGEVDNDKDVTFRMSIIGPELKDDGTGLLHWFLNKSSETVQGWDNAWWNGITTLQLAKCIETYINNPTISGIYHVVNNNNKINKYELLTKFNEIFQAEKTIIRTQGPKPVNKILIDTRQKIDFKIPDYDTMLRELKDYIKI